MDDVRRTSLNLNLELVEQAKTELGTKTTTDTVHSALAEVVRRARLRRLTELRFGELEDPDALESARREWWHGG